MWCFGNKRCALDRRFLLYCCHRLESKGLSWEGKCNRFKVIVVIPFSYVSRVCIFGGHQELLGCDCSAVSTDFTQLHCSADCRGVCFTPAEDLSSGTMSIIYRMWSKMLKLLTTSTNKLHLLYFLWNKLPCISLMLPYWFDEMWAFTCSSHQRQCNQPVKNKQPTRLDLQSAAFASLFAHRTVNFPITNPLIFRRPGDAERSLLRTTGILPGIRCNLQLVTQYRFFGPYDAGKTLHIWISNFSTAWCSLTASELCKGDSLFAVDRVNMLQ